MTGVIHHAWLILGSGIRVGTHSEAELFPGVELS